MSAGWVSPAASLLGLQMTIFSLGAHVNLLPCLSMSMFPLISRTPVIRNKVDWGPPRGSHFSLLTFLTILSPNTDTFWDTGVWGFSIQMAGRFQGKAISHRSAEWAQCILPPSLLTCFSYRKLFSFKEAFRHEMVGQWGKARVKPQNQASSQKARACGNGGGGYLRVLWDQLLAVFSWRTRLEGSPWDIYASTSAHTGNFHPPLRSVDQTANKLISWPEP